MADVKVSQLPNEATVLTGTEIFPVVQGGESKRCSINTIAGFTGKGWVAEVANYATLPSATGSGAVYLVQNSSGVWPFKKSAGLYKDTAVSTWTYLGMLTLGTLGDVKITTPANGDVLVYDLANNGWINIPSSVFAPAAQGVTNGNSHDHLGGDGGQIAYSSLSGLPTLGTAAAADIGTGDTNVVLGNDLRLSAPNIKVITQSSPSLAANKAVYVDSFGVYQYADNSSDTTSDVVGFVKTATSGGQFTLQTDGWMNGFTGLTIGAMFLGTNGDLTTTAPTTIGAIDKPILLADSTTSGYIQVQQRGMEVVVAEPFFDLKTDFTAVGDGTTDDSTAFTNAVSAAISLNKPLYCRNGVFKVAGNVLINSPITIIAENSRFKLSANNPLLDISTNYATFRGVDIEVPDTNTSAAIKITTSASRLQGRGWGPMRKVLWHNSRIVATGALNWSQTAGSGEDTTGAFIGIELVADTTGGNCGIDFIDVSDTYIEFAATGIKTTIIGGGSAWFNGNNFKNLWITGFIKAFEGLNFSGNNINGLYLHHIRSTAAVGLDLTDAESDGNTITMSAWNDSGWETTRSAFKPYALGGSGNHLTGYAEYSTETPATAGADNTIHLQTWVTTESTWPTGSVSGAVNQIADDTTINGELVCSDLKIGTSSTDGYVWTATDANGNGAWEPVSATSTLNDLGVGTLSPAHRLNVVAEYGTPATTNITFSQDVYGDANRLTLRRANGTAASPTKTLADQTIGSIGGRPHSGSAFASSNAAGINMTTTEAGDTGFGTIMTFYTTPTGSTTVAERMRIGNDGTVFIHDASGVPATLDGSRLVIEGKVESQSGGFVFPDRTTQTTAATNYGDAVADGATKGVATFSSTDFNSSAGVITIDYINGTTATNSTKGFLTSTDWNTFNNKVSSQWVTTGNDIYYTTGKVGIGINAPTVALHVQGAAATSARLIIDNTEDSSATAGGGSIMLGSTNNNQVMLLGDRLGAFFFRGTSTTTPTMQASAAITSFANQNWAAAEFGTDLVFEATPSGSNTRAEKFRVCGSGEIKINATVKEYSGSKTLTNTSANNVFEVALASNDYVAGQVEYAIYANDASDYQVHFGKLSFGTVSKAGSISTPAFNHVHDTNNSVRSTGTLTDSWACNTGTGKITLALTPTSSLTPTTLKVVYQVRLLSVNSITPL